MKVYMFVCSDAAVNYKSPSFHWGLHDAAPYYVNVYRYSVGKKILDAVLERAGPFRPICHVWRNLCVYYNEQTDAWREDWTKIHNIAFYHVRNDNLPLSYRYLRCKEGVELVACVGGELKTKKMTVKGGLKEVYNAFSILFRGANKGKLLLKVKSIDDK